MHIESTFRTISLGSALFFFSACANLGPDGSASTRGPADAYSTTANPMLRNSLAAEVVMSISAAEARRLAAANNLTGRRSLPPGIQRNLERGKPLPPGIARQMVPQSMLAGLPVYPEHEWRIAGDDLILVALGTQLVVQLLNDVFQ